MAHSCDARPRSRLPDSDLLRPAHDANSAHSPPPSGPRGMRRCSSHAWRRENPFRQTLLLPRGKGLSVGIFHCWLLAVAVSNSGAPAGTDHTRCPSDAANTPPILPCRCLPALLDGGRMPPGHRGRAAVVSTGFEGRNDGFWARFLAHAKPRQ